MKKTTKNTITTARRRLEEAQAVEASARETLATAQQAYAGSRLRSASGGGDGEAQLAELEAQIAHLRAVDDLDTARRNLTAELVTAAIAEGDTDALTAHPEHVAAGLRELVAAAREAEAKAHAAWQAAREHVAGARAAHGRLAARLAADGLPPPAGIPSPMAPGGLSVDHRPQAVLGALDAKLEGKAPRRGHEQQIARLEREATRVRIELESAARERDKQARERERLKAERAKGERVRLETQKRDTEEWLEAGRKQVREREAMADAYRKRRTGTV